MNIWIWLMIMLLLYFSIFIAMYILHRRRIPPFYHPLETENKYYPIHYHLQQYHSYWEDIKYEMLIYIHFIQLLILKYVTLPKNKLFAYFI